MVAPVSFVSLFCNMYTDTTGTGGTGATVLVWVLLCVYMHSSEQIKETQHYYGAENICIFIIWR